MDHNMASYLCIKSCVLHLINVCNFYFLIATVNGQCDGSIELMIDNQPLNSTVVYKPVVYKPVGSSGIFVSCHKCDDNINKPIWYSLITRDRLDVCSKAEDSACSAKEDSGTRGLKFLNFTSSLVGLYQCRINGGFRLSVNISVLG